METYNQNEILRHLVYETGNAKPFDLARPHYKVLTPFWPRARGTEGRRCRLDLGAVKKLLSRYNAVKHKDAPKIILHPAFPDYEGALGLPAGYAAAGRVDHIYLAVWAGKTCDDIYGYRMSLDSDPGTRFLPKEAETYLVTHLGLPNFAKEEYRAISSKVFPAKTTVEDVALRTRLGVEIQTRLKVEAVLQEMNQELDKIFVRLGVLERAMRLPTEGETMNVVPLRPGSARTIKDALRALQDFIEGE